MMVEDNVLPHIELIVVRVCKNPMNALRMSKPCCECVPLIKRWGVAKIHYSTQDGKIVTEHAADLENDFKTTAHIIREMKKGK